MEPFLGQITLYPYTFAPKQWAFCNGQIVPIQQFTALFSILGTMYGGNGTSNFGLPEMRGRVAVGMGQGPGLSPYQEGEIGGAETITLNATNNVSHSHSLMATTANASTGTAQGNQLATGHGGGFSAPNTATFYSSRAATTTLAPAALSPSGSASPVAHSNLQPYLTLSYCIAMVGVFPQRG